MARTPKAVEDRREQIIEAALIVFAQKGFERATNKDIAQQAGITPGLIYHYFQSKEDLLRSIFEVASPLRLLNSFSSNRFTEPPELFLRTLAYQILMIVESEQYEHLARLFMAEVSHNSQVATIGLSAMKEVATVLEQYLKLKMEQGVLRPADPSLMLQLFGGSIMAMVIRRLLLRDPLALQYTHDEIVEGIVSLTLYGLVKR